MMAAAVAPPALASPDERSPAAPPALLKGAGALDHAGLTGRLAADMANVWEGGEIGPSTAAAWTEDVLDAALYSLALIDSSRARPRAGSTQAVRQTVQDVEQSLWWQDPVETARLLRILADDLRRLDGDGRQPQVAEEAWEDAPSHQHPPQIRVWRPTERAPAEPQWAPLPGDEGAGSVTWAPID